MLRAKNLIIDKYNPENFVENGGYFVVEDEQRANLMIATNNAELVEEKIAKTIKDFKEFKNPTKEKTVAKKTVAKK